LVFKGLNLFFQKFTKSKMFNKANLLKELCLLLIANKRGEAISFAEKCLPFTTAKNIGIKEYEKFVTISPKSTESIVENSSNENSPGSRGYSKYTILEVFRRDGFIDRYTGIKLVHPGLLFLLQFELPEIFRYHGGWKLGECHMVFWELFPTVDHIVPITKGGSDEMDNLLTISMIGNTKKKNTSLSELGWRIHPEGSLNDWDGLTTEFLTLMKKNNDYSNFKLIPNWQIQFQKLKDWKRVTLQPRNKIVIRSKKSPVIKKSSEVIIKKSETIETPVKVDKDNYSATKVERAIAFADLPVGSLFSYGNAKTIYRKLPPVGNSLGRVVNLCRPQSDRQREWGLVKHTEMERIVRPIPETPEILAKLFL
jgi:hypothetical protein